jgi:hypothetical protein
MQVAFSMWALGLLGAGRRLWDGRRVVALMDLAFSPLMIVFAHSYGGEAVYRAYLSSLLGRMSRRVVHSSRHASGNDPRSGSGSSRLSLCWRRLAFSCPPSSDWTCNM